MKICVIIPTLNEEKAIGGLIREIKKIALDVLVVDDGSHDKTSQIAKSEGAHVISNNINLGKGIALRQGFKYATHNNYDAVITMDGDGQHNPKDIQMLIDTGFNDNETGIVVGNRMFEVRNMPILRILTNRIMSNLISFVCRQNIPDSQCGFRLIKCSFIRKIDLSSKKYEIESEILIKSSRLKYKIKSIPIQTIYAGEKSQINPFIDTFRFIKFIIKEYFTK
ncbi:MAG: glycosyltransferase family 2 protein [Candidatus Gygaella obscura]|nr:glycosyltransferase family 2 protein [Candidatus Gygaella obscura]